MAAEKVRSFVDPHAAAIDAAAARTPGKMHRALFLDRDGVINVDYGYVHEPARTQWMPGIFELVRLARAQGWVVMVVTNQAGIARGYYSEEDFLSYARWQHVQFAAQNAPLLATYYCPHHPEAGLGDYKRDCLCRKPAPGMLTAAAAEWEIDLSRSILLGDRHSDISAAHAAGISRSVLWDGSLPIPNAADWLRERPDSGG